MLFYHGRLKDGCSESDRVNLVPGLNPLVFLDCHGKEQRENGSMWNHQEAKACVSICKRLMGLGVSADDIGIICFFREQAYRIKRLIGELVSSEEKLSEDQGLPQHAGCGKPASISVPLVSTVDSFQGNEKKVIILSTVVTSPGSFGADPKRLNVALTRAQNHLIVVGCAPALSESQRWSTILRYIRSGPSGTMLCPGEPVI